MLQPKPKSSAKTKIPNQSRLRRLHTKLLTVISLMTLAAVLSASVPAQSVRLSLAPTVILENNWTLGSVFYGFYEYLTGGKTVQKDEPEKGKHLSRQVARPISKENTARQKSPKSRQNAVQQTLCVNPGGTGDCFSTIQAAIDDVNTVDGDTINVAAGTYTEEITINKQLTIFGPNANVNPNTGTRGAEAIIVPVNSNPFDASGTGPVVVTLAGDNITFSGFTIDGDNPGVTSTYPDVNNMPVTVSVNGANPDAEFGIYGPGTGSTNPNETISNNIVKNTGEFGIFVSGDPDITGARTGKSTVSNNLVDNILGVYYGEAIRVSENAVTDVTNNFVTRSFLGITVENFNRLIIPTSANVSGNNLTVTGRGVYHNLHNSYDTTGFVYSTNTITSYFQNPATVSSTDFLVTRYTGIYVESIAGQVPVTFTKNTIDANKSVLTTPTTGTYTRVRGFLVTNSGTDSPNILISENNISNAIRGVSHAAPAILKVQSNTFTGNDSGVYIGTDDSFNGSDTSFSPGYANVNFNYIVGNTVGITGAAVNTTNAENNFYGCDDGPVVGGTCDTVTGSIDADPFAVLDVSASPETIANGESSVITAKFIPSNSTSAASALPLPDGIQVAFSDGVNNQPVSLASGIATVTYNDASQFGDSSITFTGEVANADDDATIIIDDPSPVVNSVRRKTGASNPTMASSVIFTVSFNEIVTGVSSDGFTVTKTGNLSGGSVLSNGVSCDDTSGSTVCDVTVSGISTASGNGTVRLDVNSGTDIKDAGNQSVGAFTSGETYTIVMSDPTGTCNNDNPQRTYNVTTEFSLGNNPNCEYTYGNSSGATSNDVNVYGTPLVGAFGTPGIDGWARNGVDGNGLTLPGIFKNNNPGPNPTTYPANNNSIHQEPGTIALHPGMLGERSILRFTVPMGGAGFYNISGSFAGIDVGNTSTGNNGTTTDVKILVTSTSGVTTPFSGNITGFGTIASFNFPVNLANGDTVDFSVGYGNGSYGNDSTSLSAVLTPIAAVQAETLYGLSGTTAGQQRLVMLDSSNPNAATELGTITGLPSGVTLVGIDFRPATGQLYGLGSDGAGNGSLFVVNSITGPLQARTVTRVGTTTIPLGNATQFGFDFNPTVDRIRVVSNATTGNNFRLNPNNGALVDGDNGGTTPITGIQPDGNINGGAAQTQTTQATTITAAAYTNNRSNTTAATGTTLYDIDTANNRLYIQGTPAGNTSVSPNTGTLTSFVPLTGATVNNLNGFDISGLSSAAYGSFDNQLYTIDLATGVISPVGSIGTFTDFSGLTAAPVDVAPIVRSINRANPTNQTTNAPGNQVQYLITFSEQVTGLDATDFQVSSTNGGTFGVTSIVQGANDPNTYTVTVSVNDVPAQGTTITLKLMDNGSIFDLTGNQLIAANGNPDGSFTGQTYIIDRTAPTVTIVQANNQADPTDAQPVNFTVTFSEPVTGFDTTDVSLSGACASNATKTVTAVSPAGGFAAVYNVAVSYLTVTPTAPTCTVTASIPANAAQDAAGNNSAASSGGDNSVTYAPPTISISDATVVEDNGMTTGGTATFTVTLAVPADVTRTQTVTVDYATADDTATATVGTTVGDYTTTGGTLTFDPSVADPNADGDNNPLTQTISVPITADKIDEPNETFFVNLSNATNSVITDSQGLGTITDNDDAPTISVSSETVAEGGTATFTVSLTGTTSSQAVTFNYTTANDTATATVGTTVGDYTTASGTGTITAGATSTTFTVSTNQDTIDEGASEQFKVNITGATNTSNATANGTGTITDDDDAPTITISDVRSVKATERRCLRFR